MLAKQAQLVTIVGVIVGVSCALANVDHGLGGHAAAGRSRLPLVLRGRASKAKAPLLLDGAKRCTCARNVRAVFKLGMLGYTNQTANCIFRHNHPLCELIGFAIPGLPCGAKISRDLPRPGLDGSLREVINLRSQVMPHSMSPERGPHSSTYILRAGVASAAGCEKKTSRVWPLRTHQISSTIITMATIARAGIVLLVGCHGAVRSHRFVETHDSPFKQ